MLRILHRSLQRIASQKARNDPFRCVPKVVERSGSESAAKRHKPRGLMPPKTERKANLECDITAVGTDKPAAA